MSFFRKLLSKEENEHSLQDQIQRLDDLEALVEEAVGCCRAVVELMAERTPRAPKDLVEEHKKQLKRIRGFLEAPATKGLLEETRRKLDAELTSYAGQLDAYLEHQERETREVMAIVAVMAESIGARDKQYNVRFRGIGKKLRVLATSADLSEIKRKLNEEIVQLEKYVDEMSRDTAKALERVKAELTTVRTRPRPLPAGEATDAATGLPGRMQGLSDIEGRTKADLRFCLLRLEVEEFGAIQQSDGPEVAATVLAQFGALLRDSFRPGDVVCRWGEGELLVITDVRLPEVVRRIPQLEKTLAGPYRVATFNGKKEFTIRCASAIVESVHGETADELVHRLDHKTLPASMAEPR